MNIFLVSEDPVLCAQALDDLRLNKMILETAQMLCVAYKKHFKDLAAINKDSLYRSTHEFHPCTVWLKDNVDNYAWGVALFDELHTEKLYRTRMQHLSWTKLYSLLREPIKSLDTSSDLNFNFNCSGINPSTGDVFEDYKLCLVNKWKEDIRKPMWYKRGKPSWAA